VAIKKPDQIYPSSQGSFQSFMPGILPDPSIKGVSFDELLKNRGVRFVHKIATPCPNVVSLVDNNHHPQCPFCDNSQILYLEEKEIWGVFSNNSMEKLFEVQGVWDVGTAVVTFPVQYEDGDQADFNIFDQLICPDFQVRISDLKEYQGEGITKCKYPIERIYDMTSITNNAIKKYVLDVDFTINTDGQIVWLPGNEPIYNEMTGIGEVMSITFGTAIAFNVVQKLHELRITQELIDGQKTAIRLPQQLLIKRDFLFTPSSGDN
jgi:hypothetical protein